jgi:uncharacterized protein (TIGR00255 family)
MTGYGQGEATRDGTTVISEVRSVNHRFLDFSLKLPRHLQHRERDVKELVKSRLARGRVYVTVTVESDRSREGAVINTGLMAAYLEKLRAFADANGMSDSVSIDTLVQLPEVVANDDVAGDDDVMWALLQESLGRALEANHSMRAEEGKAIEKDLTERMRAMDQVVSEIEKVAPGVSKKHADAFRKRVEQLLGDVGVDEDRLVTEIALMADRLDFTEEITRLRSHESQFNKALAGGGEVSKKLTYILQEMHREASTIGAKASDSEVIQYVVALKEETEKIREQVQNIE